MMFEDDDMGARKGMHASGQHLVAVDFQPRRRSQYCLRDHTIPNPLIRSCLIQL